MAGPHLEHSPLLRKMGKCPKLSTLAERSCAAAVDAHWQRAMDLHITTVPTHPCGGKRLTGFAAYEDFVRLVGKSR
ncbi:MAG: hypothetical protein HIU83_14045 [Proteobacteria bacterium]|nr:hypothetical protein [Pseudomonadota bacterium]